MLKINDLSKKYGNKIILNNINLEFEKSTSTVIVGESGSGKTTLAKIIIGLENQDGGEIIFNEQVLKPLNKREFRLCSQIQYIFQDPYSALEPEEKVKKVLEEPRKIAIRNNEKPMDIKEAISMVDEKLLDYLEQKVRVLSGGQRQKLCIARALITKPKLIIADECTAMLDKDNSEDINKLLVDLVKKENICLIYIAHEIDFEKDNWDKIVVIKEGEIVETGNFVNFANNCKSNYSKKIIETFEYFKEK